MVRTSTVTGRISGQTMKRKRARAPAPSSAAASITSWLMLRKPCDEQQHVEAVGPPDRDEGHARHRPQRIRPTSPPGGPGASRDRVLRDAELRVQHPFPDAVDDRDRQDIGQEEGRERDALQPLPEAQHPHGDDEAEERGRHHRQDNEVDRVPGPSAANSVSRHEPDIVTPTDPVPIPDERRIGEAQLHHLHRGIDEEHEIGGDEGPDKDQGGAGRLALVRERHRELPGGRETESADVWTSVLLQRVLDLVAGLSDGAARVELAVHGRLEEVRGGIVGRRGHARDHRLGVEHGGLGEL